MNGTSAIKGDLHVVGNLSAQTMRLPPACVTDESVASGEPPIDADKLEHRFTISHELFGPETEITALTKLLHICQAAGGGQLLRFQAVVITPATGNDRTVTVDLQKSTAGGAFGTVLTQTIEFDDASVARTVEPAIINTADYDEGDVFQVVVSVAGGNDAQAKGLLVSLSIDESPL